MLNFSKQVAIITAMQVTHIISIYMPEKCRTFSHVFHLLRGHPYNKSTIFPDSLTPSSALPHCTIFFTSAKLFRQVKVKTQNLPTQYSMAKIAPFTVAGLLRAALN